MWPFFIDRVQLFQGWEPQQRNSLLLITISLSLVLLGNIMRFCLAAMSFYNINFYKLFIISEKKFIYFKDSETSFYIFMFALFCWLPLFKFIWKKKTIDLHIFCVSLCTSHILRFLENIIWLEAVIYTGHQISGIFLLLLCSLIMQFYSE